MTTATSSPPGWARSGAGAQGQRQAAIRGRIAQAEASGELDAALVAAQELLALDPRDEAHHRECMRLHYLAGNTAAGLAAYEALRRMLADEFGSKPSAATEQLADALRGGARGGEIALAGPATPTAARPGALPVTLRRPPRLAGAHGRTRGPCSARGLAAWWCGSKARPAWARAGCWPNWRAARHPLLSGAGRPGDAGSPYATLTRLLRPLQSALPTLPDAASRQVLARLEVTAPSTKAGDGAQVVSQAAMGRGGGRRDRPCRCVHRGAG